MAMWAAARSRVPGGSPLAMPHPLPVRGVIDLAGPLDLSANIAGYQQLCRDTVITALLGGSPAAVPERYEQASPARLLPLGVPQVVVIGEYEDFVPREYAEEYVQAAQQAGDLVKLVVIPRAGHFEIASPRSGAWPIIQRSIRSLLAGALPE
jgi:pimeloyl-ACP methyl ester carboxylesterase